MEYKNVKEGLRRETITKSTFIIRMLSGFRAKGSRDGTVRVQSVCEC